MSFVHHVTPLDDRTGFEMRYAMLKELLLHIFNSRLRNLSLTCVTQTQNVDLGHALSLRLEKLASPLNRKHLKSRMQRNRSVSKDDVYGHYTVVNETEH
jgi:hypothetical protein